MENKILRMSILENNRLFAFLCNESSELVIYEFDFTLLEEYQSFISYKQDSAKVYGSKENFGNFTQYYNPQTKTIITKNGNFINVIQNVKNRSFFTKQIIQFQTDYFIGTVSEDFKYIATWDDVTKQIQLRTLQKFQIV